MIRKRENTVDVGKGVSSGRPPHVALLALGLVLLAILAHGRCVLNGFIWDDDFYVTGNKTIRSLDGLRQIWFEPRATPQYYPLVHTTYWLEYRLWGLRPAGFHAVNVALHAASSVSLWWLLRYLAVPGAWVGAALFAVHPVGVESVAWITERKNTLSLLLAVLAAGCWLRFRFGPAPVAGPALQDSRPTCGSRWLMAAVALFALALLSKTVTAMLVGILLIAVWWKTGRLRWSDVAAVSPMVVIGVPLAMLTVWLERHHVGAAAVPWDFSPLDRVVLAGRGICFYFTKLLWPHPLTFFYPRWDVDWRSPWQWLFTLGVLGSLLTAWRCRARFGRAPVAVVSMYCCGLFPALGFFDVYPFKYSFVADHFQYHAMPILLAAIGACLVTYGPALVGWRGVGTLVVAVLMVLAASAFQRCIVFRDVEALYIDTLVKNPRCAPAAHNLGSLYLVQGRQAEAERLLIQSAENAPFPDEQSRSLATLSLLVMRRNDIEAARRYAEEAVRVDSNTHSRGALALSLVRSGRTSEAGEYASLDADRPSPEMQLAMAEIALMAKDIAKARQILEAFVTREDQTERNLALLEAGVAVASHSFPKEAEEILGRIDGSAPIKSKALVNMGICRAMRGELDNAIATFQEASRLDPQSSDAYGNLGKALAAAGRREEAIVAVETAKKLSRQRFAFERQYESVRKMPAVEKKP